MKTCNCFNTFKLRFSRITTLMSYFRDLLPIKCAFGKKYSITETPHLSGKKKKKKLPFSQICWGIILYFQHHSVRLFLIRLTLTQKWCKCLSLLKKKKHIVHSFVSLLKTVTKYSVNHMMSTNWLNDLFCEGRSQKLYDAMTFAAYLM